MSDATTPRPLRIALPKGRMASDALDFFRRAGIPVPAGDDGRKLIRPAAADPAGGAAPCALEYVMAKPADVPTFVEYGAVDLGVCGLDTLRESGRNVYEPLLLPFGRCHLSLCAPAGHPSTPLRYELQPRVATKYPRLTLDFFRQRGVNAEVIPLNGSVELGPLVGLADLIVDLVETGGTLRAHGLVELRTVMESQAVLIANRASYRLHAAPVRQVIAALRRRMDSD